MNGPSNRRTFLQTSLAVGSGSLLMNSSQQSQAAESRNQSVLLPGQTILFQGDSITDTGRSRTEANKPNLQTALGKGYAWMAAAALLTEPEGNTYSIYNRGISGNKVHQLADRWQAECLDLNPDVLSILIGVNDIWHALNGRYDGTVETYESDYRALLKRTKQALPEVTLVICEPFVLKCGAVNDDWFPEFDKFRAAAKKLSQEFHTIFVPFQSMFDEAVHYAPPEHWAADGVHPSPFGASLMAATWLRTVKSATLKS